MTKEKRRFSRIYRVFEVQVTTNTHHYKTSHVTNLGIGGCLLGIGMDLKAGDVCSLSFVLGNADTGPQINVAAEVIRCQSDSTALKFTGIDPDSLFHLQNLIRYNSEDPEAVEHEIEEHPGLV
jgi:hypothetical protein